MTVLDHVWIIPALPLLGAAVNGLLGRRWPKGLVDKVAVRSTGLSFLAALECIREFTRLPANQIPWVKSYFVWLAAGEFRADFALQVDQLTVVMLVVVAGVGWVIHIYSTGYMAHEGGYYRFFSYLNLFMFFMLILVMAANFALMFVGWEGVGLCSYLLIGFYFLRKSAADAGKKAFVVNRIGDFGFLLAMFLTFQTFGSLDFARVFPRAADMPEETLTAICLLLFAGAIGKSAQLPLYVWLPDAMEGPTPVSALIHAATMVTAGVYMVARSNALFSRAPLAMEAVAIVGCLTAFYAATIGLVQTDIKRVLAYSTVSQLGYMFLGCGVGAYAAGIFHLFTHAFFKALLFLAAGSVIHSLGGEQDLRRMGGLREKIPWTFATMLAATLAIAGTPFFSGFFSKDAILWQAYASGNKALWAVGLVGALLTAFYMFRLIFLAFYGAPRYDAHSVHVHESPWSMRGPLVVLAVLSVVGGFVGVPAAVGGADRFDHFLEPVFATANKLNEQARLGGHGAPSLGPESGGLERQLMGFAIAVAAAGFLVAWWFYIRRPQTPEKLAGSFHAPYRLLLNKYYVDEIYDALVVHPIQQMSTLVLWRGMDVAVIDGSVNGLAHTAQGWGQRLRQFHSGNTRSYAAWVVFGAVMFTSFLLWRGEIFRIFQLWWVR